MYPVAHIGPAAVPITVGQITPKCPPSVSDKVISSTNEPPRLWQATDMSYSELISRLIDLALERRATRQVLKISL
ncbi:D-alanine--D-alanine ligase [Pseudomonas chlororaphis]|uniref:D-alanine--D-alanine ligase n=1 Tax=Pseudomonas chlororaphis TaxID=587753 RepID=A0A3G7TW35_9PSED|nr:D-alanine--D-alanine ligase [Pseudomonas chlororaphis]